MKKLWKKKKEKGRRFLYNSVERNQVKLGERGRFDRVYENGMFGVDNAHRIGLETLRG